MLKNLTGQNTSHVGVYMNRFCDIQLQVTPGLITTLWLFDPEPSESALKKQSQTTSSIHFANAEDIKSPSSQSGLGICAGEFSILVCSLSA